MTVIDLDGPTGPPTGHPLESAPRRLALTLPELRLVAEAAGGAPLPFEVSEPAERSALDGRLGVTPAAAEDTAYAETIASLHDPASSLARRGLLSDTGRVDDALRGAVGLLASPDVALDLEVTAGDAHALAWHRQAGGAVATLATADGIVFELAWFPVAHWPGELARAAVLPEDLVLSPSAVAAALDVPYELADAAGEAVRTGRGDLVSVLVSRHGEQHGGQVTDRDGTPLSPAEAGAALHALATEPRGRLRALLADVSGPETTTVGVVSWVLLADGWHALRPRHGAEDDVQRVEVRRVEPVDLAAELAPVLAEVLGSPTAEVPT